MMSKENSFLKFGKLSIWRSNIKFNKEYVLWSHIYCKKRQTYSENNLKNEKKEKQMMN